MTHKIELLISFIPQTISIISWINSDFANITMTFFYLYKSILTKTLQKYVWKSPVQLLFFYCGLSNWLWLNFLLRVLLYFSNLFQEYWKCFDKDLDHIWLNYKICPKLYDIISQESWYDYECLCLKDLNWSNLVLCQTYLTSVGWKHS